MKKPIVSLWLTILFLFAGAIYLKTLCPTIYVGDTGELLAAGYGLGITHPPGYPLYTTIGRLFSLLPLGEIAWRFNLLSAFFTLVAIAALAYYLFRLFGSLVLATALALMWAWGITQWEMAATAEVYQVLNFLFLLLLIALDHWKTTHKQAYLYLSALIFGLGLSAHYSFLLFLPAAFLYLGQSQGLKKFWQRFSLLLALGLLGWLMFAYLPLRASRQPLTNWGNCWNFSRLKFHLLRSEYNEAATARGWQQFGRQFYYLGLFIKNELPLFSGFVAFLGLAALYLKHRAEFVLTSAISLVMLMVAAFFLNYDTLSRALGFGPKFFLPFYVVLLICLGALLDWVINKTGRLARYFYLLTLLLPLASLLIAYPLSDYSKHRLARYLGEDILATTTANASLMVESEDNEQFILAYFKNVLGKRADLKVFDPFGNLFAASYRPFFDMHRRRPPDRHYRQEIEILAANDKHFQPVFYTVKPYLNAPFQLTGLLYYSQEATLTAPPTDIWQFYHHKDWAVPLNYWSRYVVYTYPFHQGEYLLKERKFNEAEHILLPAYAKVRGMQWQAFNLGVIFQENECANEALAAYAEELRLGIPNREALINIGLIYSKMNLLAKALDYFKAAAAIKLDVDILNAQADLYYRAGNYAKAASIYEHVIKYAPQKPDIYFNRALTVMQIDKPKAKELWQQFIRDFAAKANTDLLQKAAQNLEQLSH